MMKKDIRMIGIDLDGTLLTRNKELTPASREALVSAIRAGIEVVPVTGRPLSGVPGGTGYTGNPLCDHIQRCKHIRL